YVNLANELKKLGNHQDAFGIITALNKSQIDRLNLNSRVDKSTQKLYEELRAIYAITSNVAPKVYQDMINNRDTNNIFIPITFHIINSFDKATENPNNEIELRGKVVEPIFEMFKRNRRFIERNYQCANNLSDKINNTILPKDKIEVDKLDREFYQSSVQV